VRVAFVNDRVRLTRMNDADRAAFKDKLAGIIAASRGGAAAAPRPLPRPAARPASARERARASSGSDIPF
jgi:hypothetical protein